MDFLTEGTFINIKRTDGRVHSAMVAKVNPDCKSVTVEWNEKGETKGKEIELAAIMSLNAERFTGPPEPEPKKQATAASNLQRNPTQGAIRIVNPGINTGKGKENLSRLTLNQQPSQINGTGHPTQTRGISDHHNLSEITPLPVAKLKANNNLRMSTTSVPNTGNAAAAAGPRCSYVVKEVEKLKENREKRRARQAEMKEEKTALMNMDPGNPNWELAAMIREFQSTIDFRPLCDGQAMEDHQITVCVRKRPVNRKEINKKELDVISVPTKDQLIVHEPKSKVDLTKFLENHKFRFDYAFDDKCNNELVYKYTAKPLVQTIFEGGMATCFAYGQTGSGKTHTMGGEFNGKVQDCKNGIYAMAAKDVFALLKSPRYSHLKLVVSASFFEIYSGKVFDLLSGKERLRILEDGKQQVQVVGLTEKTVENVEAVLKLIQVGNSARTAGQTAANSNSSRSHAVFQILLRPSNTGKVHGKFSFIDLAGNERGADTCSANRQTRMEGAEINKSLLALKECIRALGKQSSHLPFRVSKLTHVLRDSFIGEKSKTCMIAMISPGLSSCEHTLNTLRYANRVKELVVNDVSPTEDDDELREADTNGMDMNVDDEYMGGDGLVSRANARTNPKKNGQANVNELAQLRSLSDHDMSVEMYNQHAAISDLQQTEELLHDQHKAFIEFMSQYSSQVVELYKMTNNVEYDQDAYCKRGEALFNKMSELVTSCKELMTEFRTKLTNEELLSHNIGPTKR